MQQLSLFNSSLFYWNYIELIINLDIWYEMLTNLAMKVPFDGRSIRIELRAYKMHITKPSKEMIAFCRDICDSWQILSTNVLMTRIYWLESTKFFHQRIPYKYISIM